MTGCGSDCKSFFKGLNIVLKSKTCVFIGALSRESKEKGREII
jgi:hypothetical protein